MEIIVENLKIIKQRIYAAEQKYSRSTGAVKLLVVSKTQSLTAIQQIISTGYVNFGENYLQEALKKVNECSGQGINWHFIGPIQSNKTKLLAENFNWIQSLDREKIAQRLSDSRQTDLPPINVCIQVNIDEESSKSGIFPNHINDFANFILRLPGLRLRGLMVIPRVSNEFDKQREVFRKARMLYETLQRNGVDLDTLSMGMSNDLEAAIAEGSTMVRIGTAIFGSRQS